MTYLSFYINMGESNEINITILLREYFDQIVFMLK